MGEGSRNFLEQFFFRIVIFNGQQPWRPDGQHGPGQPAIKKYFLSKTYKRKEGAILRLSNYSRLKRKNKYIVLPI